MTPIHEDDPNFAARQEEQEAQRQHFEEQMEQQQHQQQQQQHYQPQPPEEEQPDSDWDDDEEQPDWGWGDNESEAQPDRDWDDDGEQADKDQQQQQEQEMPQAEQQKDMQQQQEEVAQQDLHEEAAPQMQPEAAQETVPPATSAADPEPWLVPEESSGGIAPCAAPLHALLQHTIEQLSKTVQYLQGFQQGSPEASMLGQLEVAIAQVATGQLAPGAWAPRGPGRSPIALCTTCMGREDSLNLAAPANLLWILLSYPCARWYIVFFGEDCQSVSRFHHQWQAAVDLGLLHIASGGKAGLQRQQKLRPECPDPRQKMPFWHCS